MAPNIGNTVDPQRQILPQGDITVNAGQPQSLTNTPNMPATQTATPKQGATTATPTNGLTVGAATAPASPTGAVTIGTPSVAAAPTTATKSLTTPDPTIPGNPGYNPAIPPIEKVPPTPVVGDGSWLGGTPKAGTKGGDAMIKKQATPKKETTSTEVMPPVTAPIITDWQKELDKANEEDKAAKLAAQAAGVQNATDLDAAKQTALENLQAVQDRILADRNASLEASAGVERADAKLAFDKITQELELQRARTNQQYEQAKVDQELSKNKQAASMERSLAVLGGYGSLVATTKMGEVIQANDRAMQTLLFNHDTSDRALTNDINNNITDYRNNLQKIEVEKQNAVQSNYDEYLKYVTQITADKNMSSVEKSNSIRDAQSTYTNNVSKINSEAFNTRYKLTTDARDYADKVTNANRDDARAVIKDMITNFALDPDKFTPEFKKALAQKEVAAGYPSGTLSMGLEQLKNKAKAENLDIQYVEDDYGNSTVVAVDKTTGKPVSQVSLGKIGKQTTVTDVWGNKTFITPNGAPAPQTSPTSDSSGITTLATLADNVLADNCVEWVKSEIPALANTMLGSTIQEKKNAIAKYGSSDMTNVQVGDAILTSESDPAIQPLTGHAAKVIAINGDTLTLEEANYKSDRVTSGRTISKNDSKMLGFISKDAKIGGTPKTEKATPAPISAATGGSAIYDAQPGDNQAMTAARNIIQPGSSAKITDYPEKARGLINVELAKLRRQALSSNDTLGYVRASAGGKALGETDTGQIIAASVAAEELPALENMLNDASTGPIVGRIQASWPYATKAKAIQAALIAITPNIARGVYGEKGVLTDADVKNYIQTLPTITNTAEQNKIILAMTYRIAEITLETRLKNLAMAEKDVSGYAPLIEELQRKRAALKLEKEKASTGGTATQDAIDYVKNLKL